MYDARTVASLYARRRRLTLGLADFERRAEAYRKSLAEVEAELRTMVLFVPPLIQRGPPLALARAIMGYVREADGPLSVGEIARRVMADRGIPDTDPRMIGLVRKRVRGALARLRHRGRVTAEDGAAGARRWEVAG